jgi:uncharacterized membrane protein
VGLVIRGHPSAALPTTIGWGFPRIRGHGAITRLPYWVLGLVWVSIRIGCRGSGPQDRGEAVSTSTLEVFVAMYGSEDGAAAAAKDFQAAQRDGAIDLIDAAVIVHTADGKVRFEETADPSGKKWAKRGAIAGGVVGLIFPPSIIVSAAVAGSAGGVWGKVRDKGFKDEDLKEIGNSLPPGSSAIIAVAEDRMVEQMERALGGYEKIAKHVVSAEAAAAIVAEIDDSE